MERTVFALFDDMLAAQRVAAALERDGFNRAGMSMLAPDPRGRYVRPAPDGTRAFTQVNVPGLGPAAVAGPLVEALADGAGLIQSLSHAGFSEPDARHYFESLRRGQSLIAVESAKDQVPNVVEVMRRLGARAVDEIGVDEPAVAAPVVAQERPAAALPGERASVSPAATAPVAEGRAPAPAAATAPLRDNGRDRVTVPVVEEQLEVGKRQVNRGGVRIHSHIVEEPIEEQVSLREERVTVERRPVYRDATEADLAEFKEGSIEIHETVEEPVISKRRRVVEEVVIGRETSERTATISETVRRTQVDVEPLTNGHDAG